MTYREFLKRFDYEIDELTIYNRNGEEVYDRENYIAPDDEVPESIFIPGDTRVIRFAHDAGLFTVDLDI